MKKAKASRTSANRGPTLQDDIDLVLSYQSPRSKMPSRGMTKLDMRCPKCGYHSYSFAGRWKRCETCGLDNYYERMIKIVRARIQRIGDAKKEQIRQAAEYIRRHLYALSAERKRRLRDKRKTRRAMRS